MSTRRRPWAHPGNPGAPKPAAPRRPHHLRPSPTFSFLIFWLDPKDRRKGVLIYLRKTPRWPLTPLRGSSLRKIFTFPTFCQTPTLAVNAGGSFPTFPSSRTPAACPFSHVCGGLFVPQGKRGASTATPQGEGSPDFPREGGVQCYGVPGPRRENLPQPLPALPLVLHRVLTLKTCFSTPRASTRPRL